MENTDFVKECIATQINDVIKREILSFDELFNLKYPAQVKEDSKWMFFFSKFEIFAKTKKDFNMRVWNGHHPPEKNTSEHICPTGTKVRIWMVSRMGDIGITDNMVDPKGYDCRGVDNADLEDWEFIRKY